MTGQLSVSAVSLLIFALVCVSVSVACRLFAHVLFHYLSAVFLPEVHLLLVYYIGCTLVVESFSLYSI